MESKEYNELSESIKRITGVDKNIARIYKLKSSGKLNKEFRKYVYENFKIILKDFIQALDDPELAKKPYYRKVYLYNENNYIDCFIHYGYELSTWLNKEKYITPENNKSYFNFPQFFRDSCRRCGITNKYTKMSDQELDLFLGDCIDLIHEKSLHIRKDRDTVEDEINVAIHTIGGKDYEYDEYSYDELKNDTNRVFLINRDYGQGYGFDVLVVDEEKEELVKVVKTDDNNFFRLTRTDYKVMNDTLNRPNSFYTIRRYNKINNLYFYLYSNTYKFDKERMLLVDIKDSNNICKIEPRIGFNKTGTMKIEFFCTPETLKENKKLVL